MCWSLGNRSVHYVFMVMLNTLILAWNVNLDMRNFPKESFHNRYIPSESFMSEKLIFCHWGKKRNPIPEILCDLCYRDWELLISGCRYKKSESGISFLRLTYPQSRHCISYPPVPLSSPERNKHLRGGTHPILTSTAKTDQMTQIPKVPFSLCCFKGP